MRVENRMKRTPITAIPVALDRELELLVRGAKIYDSSSSPEARVYFIEKDRGYYLKVAAAGTLEREAEMATYFRSLSLGAEVLHFATHNGHDLFLTARLAGEDCTHEDFLAQPKWLSDTIATELRKLHEINPASCPIKDRTAEYIKTVEKNYSLGKFDPEFGFADMEKAYSIFKNGKDSLKCDTLLHGDYCLPNIMLKNRKLSGFIDLGSGGIGDRHIDLFWGAWTLNFNLKTDKYRERFFDAYGRDLVDPELIKVIAAAEGFG